MTFCILGTADKRPVAYPLLYVLNLLGRTLFVSDDGAYRRLLTDRANKGTIGNVHVYISAEMSGEALDREDIRPDFYEHTVYALLDDINLPERDGALIIYAAQDASSFCPAESAEQMEGVKTVHIGFAAPKRFVGLAGRKHLELDKGSLFIPVTDSLLKELHAVENLCRLNPPKNAKVIRVLTDLLASGLGYGDKEMKRLLRYKGGRLT